MKLVIKILKGDECTVEVEDSATFLEVKKKIQIQCNTPVAKQRLLFLGKPLIDDKQIKEYSSIKDGSKIYLVIKTPDPLDVALSKFFKQHLSQTDADKYSQTATTNFTNFINECSLDDLERIAKYYVEEDTQAGTST